MYRCRLGSHLPDAKTVTRVLKLKNTSPMGKTIVNIHSNIINSPRSSVPLAVRVDWRMMNILQEDDKIIDLITFIGEAFPKNSFLTDFNSDTTMQTNHLRTTSLHSHTPSYNRDIELEDNTNGVDGGVDLDKSAEMMECYLEGGEPLIRALIKPHEGTCSHHPFDIHPRQIVSSSVFTVLL